MIVKYLSETPEAQNLEYKYLMYSKLWVIYIYIYYIYILKKYKCFV